LLIVGDVKEAENRYLEWYRLPEEQSPLRMVEVILSIQEMKGEGGYRVKGMSVTSRLFSKKRCRPQRQGT
jgi:hypothetical protein